jgi:2-oxoglutarate ferredoxin oxidoreductase subunit gamma
MQYDVIFGGFGGQGALFAGRLLAYTAMDEGFQVTWLPSYGPEMRGGTAHCTVIVADEEIGAPIVRHPTNVVAFNNASIEKYEPLLATDGNLIYNASLAVRPIARTDIHAFGIPASEIAVELGNPKLLNMVMLGALLERMRILPCEAVERALAAHLSPQQGELLVLNSRALRRGMELAQADFVLA